MRERRLLKLERFKRNLYLCVIIEDENVSDLFLTMNALRRLIYISSSLERLKFRKYIAMQCKITFLTAVGGSFIYIYMWGWSTFARVAVLLIAIYNRLH